MTRSRTRRGCRAGATEALVAVVAGSLLTLVPNSAEAREWGDPGLNGAQLHLSQDGYPPQRPFHVTSNVASDVQGRGFRSADVAHIFQCKAGETDLRGECMVLGTAPTGRDGKFGPVTVSPQDVMHKPGGEAETCAGFAPAPQCAVVAATFHPTTLEPTAKAEHYICAYPGLQQGAACQPRPNHGSTTSSSTPTATSTTTSSTTSTTLPPLPATAPCTLREAALHHSHRQHDVNDDPVEGQPAPVGRPLDWQQMSPSGEQPSPREAAAMAYLADPEVAARRQTVLFGGFNRDGDGESCVLRDTWTWDGTQWIRHQPRNRPPARYGHVMAFDGENVVLFGGYDGTRDLEDSWTWDGADWTRHDTRGPSARSRSAMAYSPRAPAGRGAVLFGGSGIVTDGGTRRGEVLDDTWVWDGTSWGRATTGPGPGSLAYAAMAYHPGKGVVLHGGWDGATRQQTWLWDGRTWRLTNSGYQGTPFLAEFPPATQSAAMAYHPEAAQTVLQAGGYGPSPDGHPGGQDGLWDGTGWSERTVDHHASRAGAPTRLFPVMAEDRSGRLVFFGGFGPATTEYDQCQTVVDCREPDSAVRGDTWTATASGPDPRPPGVDPDQRVTVTLKDPEISANGRHTTTATATVARAGRPLPRHRVAFSTDGDVAFTPPAGTTDDKGRFSSVITASSTPGPETITATARPPETHQLGDAALGSSLTASGSAVLFETGVTLRLDPPSIPPDGRSTSRATASLYQPGVTDEQVCFDTSGDVTFSGGGCGERTSDFTWAITIIASRTGGEETITAMGTRSGLKASAVLDEGGARWFDRTGGATGPTPGRENAAMAYDEANGVTVLFGGYLGAHHPRPEAPPEEPNPIRDRYRDLFGGGDERPKGHPPEVLGDTWVWDATTNAWSKVTTPDGQPVPGPSAREGAAMAYDASSSRLVLFGGYGYDASGNYGLLGDTWTFDTGARTWTRHDPQPAPSPRYVANMASDGTGVVLFGGIDGWAAHVDAGGPTSPDGPGHLRDTWRWQHGAWTTVTPVAPPPASESPGATFTNGRPIAVPLPPPPPGCPHPNGCVGIPADPYPSPISVTGQRGRLDSVTLTLSGLRYNGVRPDGQDANDGGGPDDLDVMVVAPDGTAVMVMSDACNDDEVAQPIKIVLDDAAARSLPRDAPCQEGTFRPTDVETADLPFHSPDAFPSPAPPSAHSASLGDLRGIDPNGTWSLYVVDDGPNAPNPAGEAGRIAGGWSLTITTTDGPVTRGPAGLTSPPPRGRAAMAYHPPSGKVLLYGGTQEYLTGRGQQSGKPSTVGRPFHPLGDTWTWDPRTRTWAQEGAGAHPGSRRSAAIAYHPGTGQLVLFGGVPNEAGRVGDPTACPTAFFENCPSAEFLTPVVGLRDTWTWDGRSWARQSAPMTPPSGEHQAGMVRDSAGRLVLVSGLGEKAATWTWEPQVSARLEQRALPADGTSTTTAVATVVDGSGRPMPGLHGVRFTTDGDAVVSGVTDRGDGTYAATVTASRSGGTETLTAKTPYGAASATLVEVAGRCSPPPAAATPGAAGTWTVPGAVPAMPTPRTNPAAATGGDGRIYTFGGRRSGGGVVFDDVLDSVEVYDPCTSSWARLPPMPSGARYAAAAAAAADGRIYVAGGSFGIVHETAVDWVDVYTPGAGSNPGHWTTLPSLPVTKAHASAVVDSAGRLVVVGGTFEIDNAYTVFSTVEMLSPLNGRLTAGASMSLPRYAHAAAVMPDERVLAVGGTNTPTPPGGRNEPNAAETYDGDKWEALPPATRPRVGAGAAAGPDGLVYVAGGGVDPNLGQPRQATMQSVEAYAACADAWLPVEGMHSARWGHAVVTGPDGRIYVMGGQEAPPGSVEAYTVDPRTSPCPKVHIDNPRWREARAGTSDLAFTVSLDRPVDRPVVIGYATEDGTARSGSDYVPTSGTLTFLPGEDRRKLVRVSVLGDTIAEDDETFSLKLSEKTEPALVSFAKGVGTATILDAGADDAGGPPAALSSLHVGDQTVHEPFSGTVTANFTVNLSEAVSHPVSFDYATADGTAVGGADYTAISGRAEIPPGHTAASVSVVVLGDRRPEDAEEFFLLVSNPAGAGVGRAAGRGTILDARPGVSIGDAAVVEGNSGTTPANFTVTLAEVSSERVSVDYATADDSARAWADYAPTRGTMVFAPGEQAKVVTIGVLADTVPERTEQYAVRLSRSTGTTIGSANGTGSIYDDDGPVPEAASGALPLSPSLLLPPPPPPPPPVPVGQSHGEVQQQLQQQAQQQAQQQLQQQAQVQAQAGVAAERERQAQVERARASAGRDSRVHLATAVRPSSPVSPAAWLSGVVILGLAAAWCQRRPSPTPAPQRSASRRRSAPGVERLPNERVRGRYRRR